MIANPFRRGAEDPNRHQGFWENPYLLLAAILLSGLPVLLVEVPPLTDLPGHMARYRVQLDLSNSPALQAYYGFDWALIGNLGVDLLIVPLAKLLGLEAAVRLICFLIPVLTSAGLIWVAREVHGRVPPTAFFALPFAYNFAFLFGFLNFALSMALALIAFGLWLRLGRLEKLKRRAWIFAPLSMLLWLCHAFGWGALGLLGFSAEFVRQHDKGIGFFRAGWRAGIQALSLAPPFALMLLWRSGQVAGRTTDWFNWEAKWQWVVMVLRDRWEGFDQVSLVIAGFVIVAGAVSPRLGLSRHLSASAFVLAVVFVLLPRIVLGSAYADMRLAPYVFAVALLAIRLRPETGQRFASALAVAALAFFIVRTAGNTASFVLYDQSYRKNLAALEHIPYGARLLSFVGRPCRTDWFAHHLEHLPGMAVVRKHAFSNDQWVMPGAQLIFVYFPGGGRFTRDPSQVVVEKRCPTIPREVWLPLNEALRTFPRDAFDYVWLIEPPRYDVRLTAGMQPIWRSGNSVLFRVVDRRQPEPIAR
jgi:hypothetical protein